jgi:hypothetical protein
MEDGDSNAAALFDGASLDKAESCHRFQAILEQMDLHGDSTNVVA